MGKPLIDMIGQRYGRLTVISRGERRGKYTGAFWLCRCDCGNTVTVSGRELRKGDTRSCGCLYRETRRKAPEQKLTGSRLYNIWQGMKRRTMTKSNPRYPDYGGRGITVCPEWRDSFETFKEWALANGYRDDLTIDRIDNDGPYSPENCRWATYQEQGNNNRHNRMIEYNGEVHSLTEWARIKGINMQTLSARINQHGWSIERALTESVHK